MLLLLTAVDSLMLFLPLVQLEYFIVGSSRL